jgi:hypothetical protein
MKKFLFLLALVISVSLTTCGDPNGSKTGDGKTYTITFDANGGSGGLPAKASVKFGDPMPSLTAAPKKTDHDFTGYYDAQTGEKK